MPRSLQHDRQVIRRHSGALPDRRRDGLQRLGTDTRASKAATATNFLLRQLLWVAFGMAGMFLIDEHRLSQAAPAARDFHGVFGDADSAACRIFPGPLARHASLDSPGAAQFAAFGNRQAGGDFLSRMVSRNSARAAGTRRKRPDCKRFLPALGAVLLIVALVLQRAGHGHGLHDFVDRLRDALCRGISYRYIFGAALAAMPADLLC